MKEERPWARKGNLLSSYNVEHKQEFVNDEVPWLN